MTGVLIGREIWLQTHRKTPCDNRGRDCTDTAAGQGTPRTDQKLGRGREGFYPDRRGSPAASLNSDFWPSELGDGMSPLFPVVLSHPA